MGNINAMTFIKIILGISFAAFAISFWALMIKDCISKMEGFERYKWFMVLLLANIIGALVYYLIPRRKRIKEEGF
ncbi:MAG: hypothetical protein V1752_06945 [Candidatus Firestonebacteria bacterium]